MRDDLVVVERLTKRYGPVTALSKVSFAVRRGEFLALLGPSGCGKTTLLRLIAGFIEATEGEIRIEGRRMNDVPPDQRPVNTVFQHYALFPHLTVKENIAFGPKRKRLPREEVERLVAEALTMVGMEGYADRYPSELSGGQQQRIALARAIVNKPRVLLLDEPLGALDLKLRKRMQIELKRLHEQLGMTFVYVTHDQEEALVMADRIAVMSEGKIVQLGSGHEIYREPNSRYVADFIGEANLIDCKVTQQKQLALANATNLLPYNVDESPGSTVTLMIRPEDIGIGDRAREENVVNISGTVRDLIFTGSSTKVVVALNGGQEIVALTNAALTMPQLKHGQTVTVHWRQSNARVLSG